jgi:hypothetical protein
MSDEKKLRKRIEEPSSKESGKLKPKCTNIRENMGKIKVCGE